MMLLVTHSTEENCIKPQSSLFPSHGFNWMPSDASQKLHNLSRESITHGILWCCS